MESNAANNLLSSEGDIDNKTDPRSKLAAQSPATDALGLEVQGVDVDGVGALVEVSTHRATRSGPKKAM